MNNEKLKIYIAGPMSGYPDFNHAAFHKQASELHSLGVNVLNPAEIDGGSTDKPWEYYMRKAIALLVQADGVVVLDGWENSKGVKLELAIASALRMPVEYPTPIPPTREKAQETVLQEADRLVSGDRQSAYGHPFDDFTRTGKLWAAILDLPEVTPEQVALCMAALKISRLCHRYKRDSAVDLAGYAKCLDLVVEARRFNDEFGNDGLD
jgi:nucleoside 2-deoxyribosyltransferase